MKSKLFLAVFFLAITSTAMSQELNKTTLGPHGGVVKQAEGFQIEMKNSLDGFQTFLLDASSKPISNKNVTCKVRIIFNDKSTVDYSLKPFGDDGFGCEANMRGVISSRITFNLAKKSISVLFQNESKLAGSK